MRRSVDADCGCFVMQVVCGLECKLLVVSSLIGIQELTPGGSLCKLKDFWEKMEFDCYQPYFFEDFDTKEDFYKSTAPSEDIWKKFELLPTPPMSPTRTLGGAAMLVSPGDKLSWLSKFLGQDDEYEGQFIPDTEELFGNLSSIIIQDCMWSSFSARGQLEKVNNDRLSAIQNRGLLPAPQITGRATKAQCASPDASLATALATDCVDPAAVLTIPTNSFRKPASSGSESRTDSSGKNPPQPILDYCMYPSSVLEDTEHI